MSSVCQLHHDLVSRANYPDQCRNNLHDLQNCLIQDVVDSLEAVEVGGLEDDIAEETAHDHVEHEELRMVEHDHNRVWEWRTKSNPED